MITELSSEAAEFGVQVRRALESAGGDQLVQQAEREPGERANLIAPILGELGAWDLSPRTDTDELEAAAALCRAAGYWATPYPVAERLARPLDLEVDGLVVVSSIAPSASIAGLDLRWAAVTLDGCRSSATAAPGRRSQETALVTPLALSDIDEHGLDDIALALMLPCWTLLGTLDRVLELTRSHVLVRHQFGQALAAFQGVQFQLTDAEVERRGVDELAAYALWSVQTGLPEAVDDVLALRLAALDAADVVFRVAHQLHGAVGFCDETTLSWLSRFSLHLRRLPFGSSATEELLAQRISEHGLTGLFTQPSRR